MPGVGDEDVTQGVQRDAEGEAEARSEGHDFAGSGHDLLDLVVVRVGDEDVPRGVDRDAGRVIKARSNRHDLARSRQDLLDDIVAAVGDKDVSRGVDGDAIRADITRSDIRANGWGKRRAGAVLERGPRGGAVGVDGPFEDRSRR